MPDSAPAAAQDRPERLSESAERQVREFERAWIETGDPAVLENYLPSAETTTAAEAAALVCELVAVDMEFRWRRNAQGVALRDARGLQPRLDDYETVRRRTRVGKWPAWLAAEEYRVRQLWGDRPSHDHYVARFPDRWQVLLPLLRKVGRDLAADEALPPASERPDLHIRADHDSRAPLPHSDFVIEAHLGTGGMGKVYRARQISLRRPVAVKALLKCRQTDVEAVEQFLQEGRILGSLRHPSIVGVHGLGRFPGGGYFLVMDLIDGVDLEGHLQNGRFDVGSASSITRAVAVAIQYAHDRCVVHGDLKPSNVLLDSSGRPFVTDFGLAQFLPGDGSISVRSKGGTWAYMAPETVRGASIGTPADIYGLGALLYSLLTQRAPGAARIDTLYSAERCSDRTPNPPSTIYPDIPPAIDRVVMKCLAINPEERYQSAGKVAEALDA